MYSSNFTVLFSAFISFTVVVFFNALFVVWRFGRATSGGEGSLGSKGGAAVRALASHQCGPGSNPGVDAICGLSLLLVLSLAPRGFSPGTPVFPSPQNQHLQIPIRSGTHRHV